MCTVLVKLGLLLVSVSWCAPPEHSAGSGLCVLPAGIHIHITSEAIEISLSPWRTTGAARTSSRQL